MLQGVLKILSHGKVEKFFLQSRYSTKARQTKEMVSVATWAWAIHMFISDQLSYLIWVWILCLVFYSYHLIIKLVWPPSSLGSAARTLWWIAHALDDVITFTCVLHKHGRCTLNCRAFIEYPDSKKKVSTFHSGNIFRTPFPVCLCSLYYVWPKLVKSKQTAQTILQLKFTTHGVKPLLGYFVKEKNVSGMGHLFRNKLPNTWMSKM